MTNTISKSKLLTIAEILSFLEEQNKTKEWLMKQIRIHKVRIKQKDISLNSFEILKSCSEKFLSELLLMLQGKEIILDKNIKTLSKTLHWFFTDMKNSSDPLISTKDQVKKILALISCIQNTTTFKNKDKNSTLIVPTGDGMVIGFSDSAEKPIQLAEELHLALKKYNKTQTKTNQIKIRIGIETGPVYFIKDLEGKDTVWGPGIISARRIMDLCEENHILASQKIAEDVSRLSKQYSEKLHWLGEYITKHDEAVSIYNIYDKNIGNKTDPPNNKTDPLLPRFEFESVEIKLEITDIKNMMCHHTWIWNIKNLSKTPLETIFYDIIGDTPKDYNELNISIKDETDVRLETLSIERNREHQKQFHVKLRRPIKQNQKNRKVTLEYDWEEPERIFEYVLSEKCKKFRYTLIIPNKVKIKNRVLQVISELNIKRRADPPAKIQYIDNNKKIKVSWQNSKDNIIQKHDSFEFQW